MRRASLSWWALISVWVFAGGCTGKKEPPAVSIPGPANNPATTAGINLGKALFFDGRLSEDGQTSCGSCHLPDRSFSSGKVVVGERPFRRDVPTLYNLAWARRFFWDGAEENLESLVIKPVQSRTEMHADLKEAVSQLGNDPAMRSAFKAAFGEDTIYTALISRALSQYIRSLVVARVEVSDKGTAAYHGQVIFDRLCARCHIGLATSDFAIRQSTIVPLSNDSGYYRITRKKDHIGFFKTPSLAGLPRSAPYGHDGSYKTLEAVIGRYDTILKDSVLNTPEGKKDLISYLLLL